MKNTEHFVHKNGPSAMDRTTIMSKDVFGHKYALVLHMSTKYFNRKISSFFKMSIFVNYPIWICGHSTPLFIVIYSMCYMLIFAVFQCFKKPCDMSHMSK